MLLVLLGWDVAGLGDSVVARLALAAAYSLYHLTETSVTHRHGEYPTLYICWGMAAPDPGVAEAIAFGVAVHFVLSSGYAKLAIGDGLRGFGSLLGPTPVPVAVGSTKAKAGLKGLWWASPATMRHYLDVYGSSASARPMSARLNRAIAGQDWATAGIGWGTLLLELMVIPGLLVASPDARWIGAAAMVHLSQSPPRRAWHPHGHVAPLCLSLFPWR